MHDEHPAAYPLIGLIAGLALGPVLVNPREAAFGCLAIALACRLFRTSADAPRVARNAILVTLFTATGIALALRPIAVPRFDPDRFVDLEVPLERDWAERDGSHVLRASRFRADGVDFDVPLSVYARFAPPEIALERTLRAEALLRVNEAGMHTATVKSPRLLAYEGRLEWWRPSAWNRMLANRLERHATRYPDEVALAQALLLGRGERLTPEMRESFRRGGTYHLLVFSGLQIAFAAGVLAALLRWLRAPRASDWLLLAFAALAPPFIGPTASVARASVAIGLYALSRILQRPTSVGNLWCVAALLRLLLEPRDLTSVSFHLTYAGAGALLFLGRHLRRPFGAIAGAELAIVPLTLFHFRQYALGGSVLTVAMSPLIFAMLVASAVACAVPAGAVFETIAFLHRLCGLLNAIGFSGWYASPPLWAMLVTAALSLCAIALLRGRTRAAVLALALLLPSLAAVLKAREAARIEHPRVTFLDVGQGDAILLRTREQTILVDGGRGDRILTLLAERGVTSIDVAILTHAHPDHCAGLAQVLAQMRVRELRLSPRLFRGDCATAILATRTPIRFARDGDTLRFDGLTLTLHLTERTFRRAPENNASIVVRAEAGGRTFLLTGDIEKEAELHFLDRDLRADVLKVAHHGSRGSTSRAFLDLVGPRLAVISCGRQNLFGHPHPNVMAALARRGIRTRRTDLEGSIDVEVRARALYVRSRIE